MANNRFGRFASDNAPSAPAASKYSPPQQFRGGDKNIAKPASAPVRPKPSAPSKPVSASGITNSKSGYQSLFPSSSTLQPTDRKKASDERDEINWQMAQWDNEMDTLDQQQEQLLNNQWRLLRSQIASLMGTIADVKAEVADLKENVMSKDMQEVIDDLVGKHDGHANNHAGVLERLDYIEKCLGESADNHESHAQHKASMEQRVCYIEKTLGESVEKHASHADHKASMEQRMEFLEGMLGDSADKHATLMADLTAKVSGCAKIGEHAPVVSAIERRIQSIQEEQLRTQESMRNAVNSTIKEHYNSLLAQERGARETICRQLENRVSQVEIAMNGQPSGSVTVPPPKTQYITRQPSAVPSITSSFVTTMSPRLSTRELYNQVPGQTLLSSVSSVQPMGTVTTSGPFPSYQTMMQPAGLSVGSEGVCREPYD